MSYRYGDEPLIENFLAMAGPGAVGQLRGVTVVSIGPLTTKTAVRHGLQVDVEPAAVFGATPRSRRSSWRSTASSYNFV